MFAITKSTLGSFGATKPRDLTHKCNVAILEVKRNRGNQPTGDEDQRARDLDR